MIIQRDSNIELYRIVAMLLIVAHHFALHSGLIDMVNEMPSSLNTLYVHILGMWGKIGINCFILITGYYMSQSHISARKWLKLVCWIWFYNALLNTIFMVSGYMDFSVHTLLRVFLPIGRVGSHFASTFVIFYLFIPFLNILLDNLTYRNHQLLLILIALVFVILPYFPVYVMMHFNYLSWFICVYLYAAYLRRYLSNNAYSKHFWGITSILSIALSIGSVIIGSVTKVVSPYYFTMDSNALLALPTAISTFMYIKHIKMRHNKIINMIAASCFGVLLIHDNSKIMHKWLWHDILHVKEMYFLPIEIFIVYSLLIIMVIFIVCSLIDITRLYLIERPIFKFADLYFKKYKIWYNQ